MNTRYNAMYNSSVIFLKTFTSIVAPNIRLKFNGTPKYYTAYEDWAW